MHWPLAHWSVYSLKLWVKCFGPLSIAPERTVPTAFTLVQASLKAGSTRPITTTVWKQSGYVSSNHISYLLSALRSVALVCLDQHTAGSPEQCSHQTVDRPRTAQPRVARCGVLGLRVHQGRWGQGWQQAASSSCCMPTNLWTNEKFIYCTATSYLSLSTLVYLLFLVASCKHYKYGNRKTKC